MAIEYALRVMKLSIQQPDIFQYKIRKETKRKYFRNNEYKKGNHLNYLHKFIS